MADFDDSLEKVVLGTPIEARMINSAHAAVSR